MKNVLYYSSVFLLFFITTNITFGNVSNFSERIALLEEAFGSLNSKDDNDMLDLHERLSTMKNITNTKIIKDGMVKYGENYFLTENDTLNINKPFDTNYRDEMEAGRHRSNVTPFDTNYRDEMEAGRHRSNVTPFDTNYRDEMEAGRHRSNVTPFDTNYRDEMEAGRHRSNVTPFDTNYRDEMEAGRHRSNVMPFDTNYGDERESGRHRSNVTPFDIKEN